MGMISLKTAFAESSTTFLTDFDDLVFLYLPALLFS